MATPEGSIDTRHALGWVDPNPPNEHSYSSNSSSGSSKATGGGGGVILLCNYHLPAPGTRYVVLMGNIGRTGKIEKWFADSRTSAQRLAENKYPLTSSGGNGRRGGDET